MFAFSLKYTRQIVGLQTHILMKSDLVLKLFEKANEFTASTRAPEFNRIFFFVAENGNRNTCQKLLAYKTN